MNENTDMHCEQAEVLLAEMIYDDYLSSTDREALMKHVQGCESCGQIHADMKITAGLLRTGFASEPELKLSPDKKKALLNLCNTTAVKTEEPKTESGSEASEEKVQKKSNIIHWPIIRFIAVAAAVAVVCGLYMIVSTIKEQGPSGMGVLLLNEVAEKTQNSQEPLPDPEAAPNNSLTGDASAKTDSFLFGKSKENKKNIAYGKKEKGLVGTQDKDGSFLFKDRVALERDIKDQASGREDAKIPTESITTTEAIVSNEKPSQDDDLTLIDQPILSASAEPESSVEEGGGGGGASPVVTSKLGKGEAAKAPSSKSILRKRPATIQIPQQAQATIPPKPVPAETRELERYREAIDAKPGAQSGARPQEERLDQSNIEKLKRRELNLEANESAVNGFYKADAKKSAQKGPEAGKSLQYDDNLSKNTSRENSNKIVAVKERAVELPRNIRAKKLPELEKKSSIASSDYTLDNRQETDKDRQGFSIAEGRSQPGQSKNQSLKAKKRIRKGDFVSGENANKILEEKREKSLKLTDKAKSERWRDESLTARATIANKEVEELAVDDITDDTIAASEIAADAITSSITLDNENKSKKDISDSRGSSVLGANPKKPLGINSTSKNKPNKSASAPLTKKDIREYRNTSRANSEHFSYYRKSGEWDNKTFSGFAEIDDSETVTLDLDSDGAGEALLGAVATSGKILEKDSNSISSGGDLVANDTEGSSIAPVKLGDGAIDANEKLDDSDNYVQERIKRLKLSKDKFKTASAAKANLSPEIIEKPITRKFPVNPFVLTNKDNRSTFAMDTDTASYDMARSYIESGKLPPRDSVRMEEFINAFDYHLPTPKSKLFSITNDVVQSPFGNNLYTVRIGIKGKTIGRDQRKPAHLVFAIDTSGSMGGKNRLGLIQKALPQMIQSLSAKDHIGIISYGERARLLVENQAVANAKQINQNITSLRARGATYFSEGHELAYQIAARHYRSGWTNRIIMLSDGVANVGASTAKDLLNRVKRFNKHGISLTCIGLGQNSYNDALLEELANRGDGNYFFIDSVASAKRILVDNFTSSFQVLAEDAKVQVEFDSSRVRRFRLIGYENRKLEHHQFRNDSIDAGEVNSGQNVVALYEVEKLANTEDGKLATVSIRYHNTETGKVEEQNAQVVDRHIGLKTVKSHPRLYLSILAAEFAEHLRKSEYQQHSYQSIRALADRVATELPHDNRVQELKRLIHASRGLAR